jgi:TetR/AcrR family transcriptional regulator, transcriptional repressor of aconitase
VPRTVDPERHAARRLAIIDAAFTCFAAEGYAGATTGAICREAGIGSGTFFHYFPTKAAVLAAVLEDGLRHTREVFAGIRGTAARDAVAALDLWRDHVLAEAADENLAGFVAVLGAVPDNPDVAAALRAESTLIQEVLSDLVAAGQSQGTMRTDRAPDRIATWLGIVAAGLLEHAAEEGPVVPDVLRPEMTDVLTRLVRR